MNFVFYRVKSNFIINQNFLKLVHPKLIKRLFTQLGFILDGQINLKSCISFGPQNLSIIFERFSREDQVKNLKIRRKSHKPLF